MAQDWDIKPRGESCYTCEQPFEDNQHYYAALVFGEEGYHRADYCQTCWPTKKEEEVPYSAWKGVFRFPPPAPEEALKKETAESLLRKLMEDDDEASVNAIFILAVMLERKRMLVEKDVQTNEDGMLIRIYEHKKSGETFVVPDPRLRLDELEEVQREVVIMLGGTPPGEKPAEEPGAPAEGEHAESGETDGTTPPPADAAG